MDAAPCSGDYLCDCRSRNGIGQNRACPCTWMKWSLNLLICGASNRLQARLQRIWLLYFSMYLIMQPNWTEHKWGTRKKSRAGMCPIYSILPSLFHSSVIGVLCYRHPVTLQALSIIWFHSNSHTTAQWFSCIVLRQCEHEHSIYVE